MGTGDAQASADISASPLGKLRRRKGKLVRERTAALPGVKTLGSDAKVLVLQDVSEANESTEISTAEGRSEERRVGKECPV